MIEIIPAIDVLDEACSKAKIKAQLEAAEKEKESGATAAVEPKAQITCDNIAEAVSVWTKIPVARLTEGEKHGLVNLEAELKKVIIGQDHAVEYIARAVRRGRAGIADPNRPIGTFMFLGRTGVGKTSICRVIAKQMFLSDKALIKLDMSEFQEAHSVSHLTGAPPGYVGYDDASALCERVRRNPYCVVLFDEIEKAHPDVYNVLLQILDEGRLTDNKGKTTSFRNALVIMTSNIGVENLTRTGKIGFAGEDDVATREEDVMMQALRKRFKPEFINRIDNIVVFNALSRENIKKIAKIQIDGLKVKLARNGIHLDMSQNAIEYLVEKGYSPEYGARPLRRLIQSEIEDKIAESMLSDTKKSKVAVDAEGEKLIFRFS
jgi:ATP-dependent Clp protease ATP-binding subunit ClpC